jgi:hypothetical protein
VTQRATGNKRGGVTLRSLLPTLNEALPSILAEVVELLRVDWPDYAQVIDDDLVTNRAMAEAALRELVRIAELVPRQRPHPAGQPGLEELGGLVAFEEVGRIEWREGRTLGTLLSAYRAGARVAWRHLSQTAVERGVDPAAVASLAEALFVFIDELSAASARGYVDEQRVTAAERERLRVQLGALLISGRSDATQVRALALRAGWPLPGTAALVLADPAADEVTARLDQFDPMCLPVRDGGLNGVIVPDPDGPGRRARIAQALAGCTAAVGSGVGPAELPASVRIAEAALRLAEEGVLPDRPVFVTDHYDTILVARDPWLLERLREQVLAPLAGLPAPSRERLIETLAAWLAAMGDPKAAAAALLVHPQTVRYRLRQLATAFGPALDDPATRLRLTLALCWGTPHP